MARGDPIITRADLDEYLDGGVSGDLYRLMGVSACNFYPFSDTQTDTEQALLLVVESNPAEMTVTPDIIRELYREKYTAIYRGIKFYFENGRNLERFCVIAGLSRGHENDKITQIGGE